ncbi:MAG: pepN, partial [Friedmanniella sp.]|nr:pepN [Friedmanniella sp.]
VCRQSLVEHLDHEEIVDITTGGFEVFERHFQFPYPFGKYDQVFVPEYNGGAMENVGCVTLRDEYIFRSRATQAVTNFRRDTILHELSHMWFGDLVTMRWWDDLWLKESFATWASNFATSEQAEDPSLAWAGFCSGSKTLAYRQDQLPSTHPIAADIVDLEAVEYNFDQITYAKGASVLVQLVAFVGRDAFLAGLRDYFATHAYGNTGLVDLLASLQTASGRDLSGWSAQWLETAGVNTLRVDLRTADGLVTGATVRQSAPADWPTLRDHRVAFGVYDLVDGRLVRTDRIECDVTGAETPLPQLVGRAVPAVLLPNDDDLTYAKVRLDPRSLDHVLTSLPTLDNALSRAVLWGCLWDACRDAELDPTAFVDLALAAVPFETGPTAVRNALAQAGTASWSYTPPARRAEVRQRWESGVGSLLDAAEPASDQQLALARSYAAAANAGPGAERLAGWLREEGVPEGLRIDTDLRWSVVNNLARLGVLDEAQIDAERLRDDSITGAEQAAGARAARPDAAAKAEAWRLAVESDDVPNATHTAICLNFWSLGQDDIVLPYVDRYFAVAEDISAGRNGWARKGLSLHKNVLRLLFPWPTDQKDFLVRLDSWLETAELSSSARRVIAERRDDTLRALRCQEAAAL